MSSENKKDWERSWTTEEIIEHADDWNLACDAALLNTLRAFSDRVLQKSEVVFKKVENLCDGLGEISLRVNLARNEFNRLRNNQFVECRVYEEDETLPTDQQDGKGEDYVPKEETIEDLTNAVALGLEILDNYYETVKVNVSDSEDEEEDIPSYVYRRKDPYINRPLPYVIGSKEWYNKWHVGLQDTDSENEKSSSDKYSDSESGEDSQTKDHSDVSSELSNLSGLNTIKGHPVAVSTANTTQNNFTSPESDGSSFTASKTLNFAEQLAAKLGNVIKENEALLDEPEVNRRPIQKKATDYGALFSDQPPPIEEDSLPSKNSQGIFSGGRGLFDDEDEDDTLWSTGNPSLFRKPDISNSGTSTKIQAKGLFDEESDEEIFTSAKKPPTNNHLPYFQPKKPGGPMFYEEPPIPDELKEKKRPPGGISIFGDANIFQSPTIGGLMKRKTLSSESSDNDNVHSPTLLEKGPKPIENIVQNPIEESTSSFENIVSKKQIISTVPENKESVEKNIQDTKKHIYQDEPSGSVRNESSQIKKSGLFDDDLFGDDLFTTLDNKLSSNSFAKGGLFSNDETDEPLFYSSIFPEETSLKNKQKVPESQSPQKTPEVKDEYDYSWKKNSDIKIESIFDNVENDDFDIFSSKQSKKRNEVLISPSDSNEKIRENPKVDVNKQEDIKKNAQSKISLFDDDLNDGDDLFSEIFKNNGKPSKTHISSSSSTTENSTLPQKVKTEAIKQEIVKEPHDSEHESNSSSSSTTENATLPQKVKTEAINQEIVKEPHDSEHESNSKSIDNLYTESFHKNEKSSIPDENESEQKEFKDDANIHSAEDEICASSDSSYKTKIIGDQNVDNVNIQSQVEILSSTENNLKQETRDSINVPHMNLLDSLPPPDDAWDDASDNVFDDMETYGNDDFQSQPSSLFDNEPPSLFFNDTSGILQDHIDNRLDSVNSFDPSLTSSRRLSSDIFSDSQNNNSLFLTKQHDSANVTGQPNLESVPEFSFGNSGDYTNITPSGNPEDLYSSTTISVTDNTKSSAENGNEPEILSDGPKTSNFDNIMNQFSENSLSESRETENFLNREHASNSSDSFNNKFGNKLPITTKNLDYKKMTDKDPIKDPFPDDSPDLLKTSALSFDDTSYDDETHYSFSANTKQSKVNSSLSSISKNVISDKNIDRVCDKTSDGDEPRKSERGSQEVDDEMQNNIARLTEQLQKASNKDEETPKPKVAPRKLTHSININVGALLPGALPPKKDKTQSPVDVVDRLSSQSLPTPKLYPETVKDGKSELLSKAIPIIRTVSESETTRQEYKLEKSVSFEDSTGFEVLQSITKDRPRIPVKRRPSSRRARQQSLRNSVPDFKLMHEDDKKDDSPSSSIDRSVLTESKEISQITSKIEKKCISPDKLKQTEVSLFDDLEDEPGNLFKSLKQVKTVIEAKVDIKKEIQNELRKSVETNSLKTNEYDSSQKQNQPDMNKEFEKFSPDQEKELQSNTNNMLSKQEIDNIKTLDDGLVAAQENKPFLEKAPQNIKQPARKIVTDLFDSSDDSDDFLKINYKNPKKTTKHKETQIQRETEGGKNSKLDVNKKNKHKKNLFDSSDDDDEFLDSLTSVKGLKEQKDSAVPSSTMKGVAKSLFDDGDIFSTSSSSDKMKKDIEPSVISKKPSKSSSLRKLGNIEGDQDPLSALLK